MKFRISVYDFTPEQAGPGTDQFRGEVTVTCLNGRHEISGAENAKQHLGNCPGCGQKIE